MKDFKTFSDFMNQVNEIFLLTPPPRRSSSSSTRSSSNPNRMKKPNPNDPRYPELMRKWAEQQQEETSVSEDMEKQWARRAEYRREIEQKKRERRRRREEERERRSEVSTRGVPFYDKHGKGYIKKDGEKTYTERN